MKVEDDTEGKQIINYKGGDMKNSAEEMRQLIIKKRESEKEYQERKG